MKNYFVYILTCHNNTTFYIGVTNDLVRRCYEHRNEMIDGFTKRYNLHKLVYYEVFEDINEAILREKYLKKAYKKTKVKLVTGFNPAWDDLYEKII